MSTVNLKRNGPSRRSFEQAAKEKRLQELLAKEPLLPRAVLCVRLGMSVHGLTEMAKRLGLFIAKDMRDM